MEAGTSALRAKQKDGSPRVYLCSKSRYWHIKDAEKCQCRNHLGKPKQQHPSKDAALEAILRRHLYFANCKIVKCKSNPNIWHVVTLKNKLTT